MRKFMEQRMDGVGGVEVVADRNHQRVSLAIGDTIRLADPLFDGCPSHPVRNALAAALGRPKPTLFLSPWTRPLALTDSRFAQRRVHEFVRRMGDCLQ